MGGGKREQAAPEAHVRRRHGAATAGAAIWVCVSCVERGDSFDDADARDADELWDPRVARLAQPGEAAVARRGAALLQQRVRGQARREQLGACVYRMRQGGARFGQI